MNDNKFISILADTTMKYLMKKKETRDIYLELFSDIIGIDLTNYILVDNELNSGNNIKDLRLDLLLENGDILVNIEINNQIGEYTSIKNLTYAFRLAGSRHEKGNNYYAKQVIQINLNREKFTNGTGVLLYELRNKNYDYIYNYIKKLDYHHYGYNNYFEAQRPRYEAIINLSLGTEKLYSNIDKSYKTKIRSAKRNGIYIIKGDSNDIKTLYNQVKDKYPRNYKYLSDMYEFFSKNGNADLYLARLNTRDYLVNNQSRYENVYSISQNLNYKLTKQNNNKLINEKIKTDSKLENCKIKVVKATKLIEKYPDGIDLASVLVIKNGSQVQIIIDGYDTNYRDLNAKHLLLWELIKRYANEGYTTFNLGGVSNILLSDNKYAGLNDFKMNFGAYSVEYMGDLEVITNPTLYLLHNNPIKKLIKKKNIV